MGVAGSSVQMTCLDVGGETLPSLKCFDDLVTPSDRIVEIKSYRASLCLKRLGDRSSAHERKAKLLLQVWVRIVRDQEW